ncbi:hypothetical protein IGI03_05895 [Bacillus thuringiensis]|uniref:hypothetical protein n=1 Tax=Bacillus thuringiensis TaxID=1428 RepID=UPI001875E1F7|nr:hypothetical protein [Bacillus thuringiensis]MBE5087580.1 hypothetical protein [Bacillus thuringiensis]
MKELDVFFEALNEELNGEQMEVGDEFVYTCNNAVVIYSMDYNEKKEKTLGIRIIGGKAVHIDTELPIFE